MFKLLKFLDRHFEEMLGALVLAVMACISFVNVIARYFTNFSFASSEELTVNLFVWVTLLGTSLVFRESSNFCMSVFVNAMPKNGRRACEILGIACSIAFFALLSYYGWIEVADEMELSVESESLAIPVWIYTIATPLFSLLVIWRIVQKAAADFRGDRV